MQPNTVLRRRTAQTCLSKKMMLYPLMVYLVMLSVEGTTGQEETKRALKSHKACYVREIFDLYANEKMERKELSKEVAKIKTVLGMKGFGKTVAFTAELSSTRSYSSGSVLAFNKVMTNIGNGLKTNGIFYCPESGLYLIQASIMSNTRDAYGDIHVNNKHVAYVYAGPSSKSVGYVSASYMIFYQLQKGDTVAVKSVFRTTYYHSYGTSFSGLKIQTI